MISISPVVLLIAFGSGTSKINIPAFAANSLQVRWSVLAILSNCCSSLTNFKRLF